MLASAGMVIRSGETGCPKEMPGTTSDKRVGGGLSAVIEAFLIIISKRLDIAYRYVLKSIFFL
jgi:hypothetical protein